MFHIAILLLAAICSATAMDECPEWRCTKRRCKPVEVEIPIDLVFLVDGSESISDENFNVSLDWVLRTIDVFLNGRTELRVYLVQYSWNATLEINEAVNTSSEISGRAKNIVQTASGTRAYESLQYVNDEVLPLTQADSYKILITLTDGKSNTDHLTADDRLQIIETARRNFNIMVAVSVGAPINDEIRDFSDGIDPITVDNYISLQGTTVSTQIFDSTTNDCVELRSWCQASTDNMLIVSYCVCPPHSDHVDNYRLTISPSGTGINFVENGPGETTASFYGLTPQSSYNVTVTVETKRANVTVYDDLSVCSTEVDPCGDPNKCEAKALQLVFLVDGSESITPEDFQNSLQWVLKTINDLKPSDRNVTRVLIFQYSESVTQELDRYVQRSAEEIQGAVEGISQIRQGTRPYTALRQFINGISTAFYNVLITLSDGLSRKEDRDPIAISAAESLFDTMLAVHVGANEDANVLNDFAGDNPVMQSRDDGRIPGIIADIIRESHEECVKFTADCRCIDDMNVEVSYSTSLRGPIGSESQIISNYRYTHPQNGSISVPLGQTTVLLSDLQRAQEYHITIDGSWSSERDACAVIESATAVCQTGIFVQPEVQCLAGETDLTAYVGNITYRSKLQNVDLELMQNGQISKTIPLGDNSFWATFEGLAPSTRYTVVARPYANSCARIIPGTVECDTKDVCDLSLTCQASTNGTVTVSISITTTNPRGINGMVENITITGPNGESVNVSVGVTSYTFVGLNASTRYKFWASTVPVACFKNTAPQDCYTLPNERCPNNDPCDCIPEVPILAALLGLCIILIIILVIVIVRLKRETNDGN